VINFKPEKAVQDMQEQEAPRAVRAKPEQSDKQVYLFVTCLADLFRPSVAFASLSLIQRAGFDVVVPNAQTCCAQPAYNNGDYDAAKSLAKQVISLLEPADYVVAPSGSCAGMISHHYPSLFAKDAHWLARAEDLATKTYELTQFLSDVAQMAQIERKASTQASVTYHDGCAGLRELNVYEQPRKLLRSQCNIDVIELEQNKVCCGFGGTFCAKMPEIAAKMADDKLANVLNTNADILTGGDLGCLMNLAGRASRQGIDVEVRHVAEILNGDFDTPAIGEGS